MLGLGNAVMCGQKEATTPTSPVVLLLNAESSAQYAKPADMSATGATFNSNIATSYYMYADFTNFYSGLSAPVGSKLITFETNISNGVVTSSNLSSAFVANEAFTLETYIAAKSMQGDFKITLASLSSSLADTKYVTLRFTKTGDIWLHWNNSEQGTWNMGATSFKFIRLAFDSGFLSLYINGTNVVNFADVNIDLSGGCNVKFTSTTSGDAWSLDEFRVIKGIAKGAGMPTFPLTTTP